MLQNVKEMSNEFENHIEQSSIMHIFKTIVKGAEPPFKKIVICGCRNYHNEKYLRNFLFRIFADMKYLQIVTGGARGVDYLAEKFAIEENIKCEVHEADWKRYGRKAGPIRNTQMLVEADFVIAFWDLQSIGTKDILKQAKAKNIRFTVIKI